MLIYPIILTLSIIKKFRLLHFILNDKEIKTSLAPGITLLDFIRYQNQLTGTKIGCREGDCGACSVLVGEINEGNLSYHSVTSCLMALGNANGKHIVTIEGINTSGLNVVQEAFAEEGATQCGFCTPGFIISLTGFCISEKKPVYEDAINAINGNICRCTGYKSIERATASITKKISERNGDALQFAVDNNFIPDYFLGIKQRLTDISKLHEHKMTSSPAKKLGGGTDLYVQQHEGMEDADIDFLFDKKILNGITEVDNNCVMGGSVTAADISGSPLFQKHFKNLQNHIKLVSSTQIRNMATLAGNFTNASPIGDFTVFFLALSARLVLRKNEKDRTIALRDFYRGYKILAKEEDEIIEKISFSLPGENDLFNFEKVCKRSYLDIASVNSALYLKMNGAVIAEAGLSAGGVGPVPAFLANSSKHLAGKSASIDLILEVIAIAQKEITPISDVRGTAEYKRLLLSQLIKAHFIKLFPSIPLEKMISAS